MTEPPTFGELTEVMSRASVGDFNARVNVCRDVPDDGDDRTILALMLNILLSDLQYRAGEAEAAHLADVAQRKAADDRQVEFFTMASHELRTPLTAISGFASTLTSMWDTLSDERKLGFVRIIEEQSNRLARLVNDVLTLSRLQRGNLARAPQAIDVCEVAERVRNMFPDTEITLKCAEGMWALCDPDHLEQILVNYVSNAVKYAGAPIIVEAHHERDGVQIEVSDHGPGVPADFRSQLFNRFTQAQAGEQPEGSGTGLGLSIVVELASAQGGGAWYEPNSPNGSVFVVWLPVSETVALTPVGNR